MLCHCHLRRHLRRSDSWVHVEMFGRSKEHQLRRTAQLASGPLTTPSGMYSPSLTRSSAAVFFAVAALLPRGGGYRRQDRAPVPRQKGGQAAWASGNTLTLGQVPTGFYAPCCLEMLELSGCIVTRRHARRRGLPAGGRQRTALPGRPGPVCLTTTPPP